VGVPHLGDSVVDVDQGDRGHADEAGRMLLERQGPIVQSATALFHDPRGTDVERPDAERGVHDFAPDAVVVEVLDPCIRVVAADDAVDEVLLLGVRRTGVYPESLLRLVALREVASKLLAVDGDRLEVTARVLHARRQAVLDVIRQR
jgi:hypothetical protein